MRYLKFLLLITIIVCVVGCKSTKPRETVTIVGEVNRPGVYFIKKPTPFMILLLGARGYTENADATKVIIERKSKSIILDLSIPANKPAPHLAETFTIYPFDVITVSKKAIIKK